MMNKRTMSRELMAQWVLAVAWMLLAPPVLFAEGDGEPATCLERITSLGGQVVHWAEAGGYLYLGQGGGVRIFDQRNRDQPQALGWVPLAWRPAKLAVDGATLWVSTLGYASPRNQDAVECFDLSDPAAPRSRKYANVPEAVEIAWNDDAPVPERIQSLAGPLTNASEVLANAGRVWVRDEVQGWLLVDATDPATPALLGRVGLPRGDRPLSLLGPLVYAAGGQPGLRVYKADQPGTCSLLTELPLPGTVLDIAVSGGIAFIAAGSEG